MGTFFRVLASERLKLSKSFIWLLVPISPLLAMLLGMMISFQPGQEDMQYIILLSSMGSFHAMLFLPILTGIFSAFICRYEHSGGGWKQLLTLPISRTALYLAKFSWVAMLLAVTQLLFVGAVLLASAYQGITEVSWETLLTSAIGGWIACLPLAALQLWASISWSSFAAPLAINVGLTVPNMLVINSVTYGPFYPWAQPALVMLAFSTEKFGALTLPLESLFITIVGSFIVFFAGGLIYFNKKEI